MRSPLYFLETATTIARAHFYLRHAKHGLRVRCHGPVVVQNRGHLHVGDGTSFAAGLVPTSLTVAEGAQLGIGEQCVINYGVSIHARQRVSIGDRVMIGSYTRLHDRSITGDMRPIVLEDDVWLAHAVIVAPGVTIGRGSVVSAGSVILEDVPPGSLCSGNPARAVAMPASSTRCQAEGSAAAASCPEPNRGTCAGAPASAAA